MDTQIIPITRRNIPKLLKDEYVQRMFFSAGYGVADDFYDWMANNGEELAQRSQRLADILWYSSGMPSNMHVAQSVLSAIEHLKESFPPPSVVEGTTIAREASKDIERLRRHQLENIARTFKNPKLIPANGEIVVTTSDCTGYGVNFGPFELTIDLLAGYAKAQALAPCVPQEYEVDDIDLPVHPNISSDGGEICLGDGEEAFERAMDEGRLYDALLIADSVLHTPNADGYNRLSYWAGLCAICKEGPIGTKCARCHEYICPKHQIKCEECGDIYCHNDIYICDCGKFLCLSCKSDHTCTRREKSAKAQKEKLIRRHRREMLESKRKASPRLRRTASKRITEEAVTPGAGFLA